MGQLSGPRLFLGDVLFQLLVVSSNLSGSLWLRQPVEDLRFDLGISFYGFTRCSWTIPNLRKSPFVIRALLAPCAAVAVR